MLSLPRAIAKSSHVSAIRAVQLEAAEQRKLKRGLWLGVHTRPKVETDQSTVLHPHSAFLTAQRARFTTVSRLAAAAELGNQAIYGLQHTRFGSHMP